MVRTAWGHAWEDTRSRLIHAVTARDDRLLVAALQEWDAVWSMLHSGDIPPMEHSFSPEDATYVARTLWAYECEHLLFRVASLLPNLFPIGSESFVRLLSDPECEGAIYELRNFKGGIDLLLLSSAWVKMSPTQRGYLFSALLCGKSVEDTINEVLNVVKYQVFSSFFTGEEIPWSELLAPVSSEDENTCGDLDLCGDSGAEEEEEAAEGSGEIASVRSMPQSFDECLPLPKLSHDEWLQIAQELEPSEGTAQNTNVELSGLLSMVARTTFAANLMRGPSIPALSNDARLAGLDDEALSTQIFIRSVLLFTARGNWEQSKGLLQRCIAVAPSAEIADTLSALRTFVILQNGDFEEARERSEKLLSSAEMAPVAYTLALFTRLAIALLENEAVSQIAAQYLPNVIEAPENLLPVWGQVCQHLAADVESDDIKHVVPLGDIADSCTRGTVISRAFAAWTRAFQAELLLRRGRYDYAARIAPYAHKLMTANAPVGAHKMEETMDLLAQAEAN